MHIINEEVIMNYILDLDRYNPATIIDLHRRGLITLDEIIHSGRASTCFTSDLTDYINTVRSDRRIKDSTKTTKIIGR